jgi:uncharacterized protein YecT (DUF1311 family)
MVGYGLGVVLVLAAAYLVSGSAEVPPASLAADDPEPEVIAAIEDNVSPPQEAEEAPVDLQCAALSRSLVASDMEPSDWAAYALACSGQGLPVSWRGAVAPSFNCSRASSRTEREICSDELLSVLDAVLGSVYSSLRSSVSDRSALQAMQTRWLRDVRDACQTRECMTQAYGNRILELQRFSNDGET